MPLNILFMGRKPVAARALQHLLDDPAANVVGVLTDSHLANSATADLAHARGLPAYGFDDCLDALRAEAFQVDLGVSMLYWRRLKDAYLTHPRHGIINFHPAPLPGYKGVGGYNLAILEGLDRWAASAHLVDEGIDTGEIVGTEEFAIDPERETARSLERTSQDKLFDLFVRVWHDYRSNPRRLEGRPNRGGRHLSRKELEEMKCIDPERDDIERKVRAFWFPPYDGAYVELGGRKYTLVNRQILEELADPTASSLFSPPA